MFYTDGFINDKTYFSSGYIWHLGMKYSGKECLFVCISKVPLKKETAAVEGVLKRWIEQELSQVIGKGTTAIQRELKRFHTWFKQWCSMKKGVKSPVFCLYFQRHVYFSEEKSCIGNLIEGHRGILLGGEGTVGDITEILSQSKSVEEIANTLKTDMLVAFSKGALKTGYFVIWEEEDDF